MAQRILEKAGEFAVSIRYVLVAIDESLDDVSKGQ
jgi:hypothetical protein